MKFITFLFGLLSFLALLCAYLNPTGISGLESSPTPPATLVQTVATTTPPLEIVTATPSTAASPTIVLTEESQTQMPEPGISQTQEGLFIESTLKGELNRPNEPTVIRSRFVTVNFDLFGNLTSPSGSPPDVAKMLPLNLFEDVFFTAVLDRVESNSPASVSWIGHLEGVENSQVILVVTDNVMMGNITLPEAIYEVQYAGNDIYGIYQIDQSAFGRD